MNEPDSRSILGPTRLIVNSTSQEPKISARAKQCPVGMDLAALGKKWTFHILMDIGMMEIDRFNQILRSLPGLTPRVLIMRLNELQECGLIQAIIIQEKPRLVRWKLTEKGRDTVPILEGYTSYVAKWHPNASLKNHLKVPVKYPSLTELLEIESRWNNQLDSKK
jgi:DNA-binding HxlR family transcriptional regulator